MQLPEQKARLIGARTPRIAIDYHLGHVEVTFRHSSYDILQMRIRAFGRCIKRRYLDDAFREVGYETTRGRKETVSCRITSVFCPFRSMVHWLEALTTGVQACSFEWEAEGPDGLIGWEHDGLTVKWPHHGKDERTLRVYADRAQVVRAFYMAFRRFVDSLEYHPERYESMRVGEDFAIRMAGQFTEEEFRGQLLRMGADEAERELQALRPLNRIGEEPSESKYIDKRWDRWSTARRREYLDETFNQGSGGTWFGAPLRNLRSEAVERWLASKQSTTSR